MAVAADHPAHQGSQEGKDLHLRHHRGDIMDPDRQDIIDRFTGRQGPADHQERQAALVIL